MASHDIIDSVGHAYRFLWFERRYLLRLALLPMIVKLVCYSAVLAYGYELHFIRRGLVMLPSYFVDGWMLSHIVRYAIFGQRWPFRNDAGPDVGNLQDRAQGILAGTATYVLTRFLLDGLMAVYFVPIMAASQVAESAPPPDLPGWVTVFLILMFAGIIWSFRLVWLFVPAAVNYPMRRFLREVRPFMTSFHMIGAWLVTTLPPQLPLAYLSEMFLHNGGGQDALGLSMMATKLIWVFSETVTWILSSFAIALIYRPILLNQQAPHR